MNLKTAGEEGLRVRGEFLSTAPVEGLEFVSERTAEHCGAVESAAGLETDPGKDIGATAATQGGVARPQRLNNGPAADLTREIQLNEVIQTRRVQNRFLHCLRIQRAGYDHRAACHE